MRIREKTISAACRTENGIEWTTLKVKPDGTEPPAQASLPLRLPDDASEESLSAMEIPAELAEILKGDLTVALRTSELLMRTMWFPTVEDHEIADMVGFQLDKISPFPSDQLATAHEVLDRTEDRALVLMAAAKRETIDNIGAAFKKRGIHIHSMDARVLGWLELLRSGRHLSDSGCEILIIDDSIDFSLIVLHNVIPLAFRSLHARVDDMNVIDELTQEIGYTLTTLDTEYDLPVPSAIQFWSSKELPAQMCSKLAEKSGIRVNACDMSTLPPLSAGIVHRALHTTNRIELIPTEWVDHEKRRLLRRKFTLISAAIAAVWIFILLIFFSIYKVRDAQLSKARARAAAVEPEARQALENRQKLNALSAYIDRSDSALECLREITSRLPAGDIEFVSYSYTAGKGVSLRGTAFDDDIVNEFFLSLAKSDLFERLKDQSVTTTTTKGVRRAVFAVSLVLANQEEG